MNNKKEITRKNNTKRKILIRETVSIVFDDLKPVIGRSAVEI